MFVSSFITLLAGASTVIASPFLPRDTATTNTVVPQNLQPACSLSNANSKLNLPAGQTALAVPTTPPSFIAMGVGTQNYTCGAAGTFVSAGAFAQLADISCLVNTPLFNNASSFSFSVWSKIPPSWTSAQALAVPFAPILGQHYFVSNGAGGISPKWDFTSNKFKGNANAFITGAKVAGLAAPTGSQDVDWLQVKQVSGNLATMVYRTDTRGGQPPASCKAGDTTTVRYTSKYWLYGSTV